MFVGVLDVAKGFVNKITNKSIGDDSITTGSMRPNSIDHHRDKLLSGLGVPSEFLSTSNNFKKSKIRGKVPTRSQRQILVANGVSEKEQESYLIQKISLVKEETDKYLHKSSNKDENWTLIHRDTGELKEVYIA